MGRPVKTTLNISDDLLERAKLIQLRDAITFKALVEEGLRLVIAKRTAPVTFRFEPVFGGKGWLTEEAERAGGLGALLKEVNER